MKYFKKFKYVFSFMGLISIGVCCKQHDTQESENHLVNKDSLDEKSNYNSAYRAPKDVDEVKQLYAIWKQKENQDILKKDSLDYKCKDEKNGTLTYFSEQGNLRIIEHHYSEYDHFSATDRYYIIDDKPFFIHSKEVAWSFEAEGKTKDNVTEYRGYIIEGTSVQCFDKKYILKSGSDTNPDPDQIPNKSSDCKNIQQLVAEYENLLKSKKSRVFNCN